MKRRPSPLEEGQCNIAKNWCYHFVAFSKGICSHLPGWLCIREGKITRLFRDHCSLALNWYQFLGIPMSLWSTRQSRKFWGSSDQWSLAEFISQGGPLNTFCGYSPILKCVITIDMCSYWQNLHIASMTLGERAIVMGKWKPLELFTF